MTSQAREILDSLNARRHPVGAWDGITERRKAQRRVAQGPEDRNCQEICSAIDPSCRISASVDGTGLYAVGSRCVDNGRAFCYAHTVRSAWAEMFEWLNRRRADRRQNGGDR